MIGKNVHPGFIQNTHRCIIRRQIHFGRIIRPGSKLQTARLSVERVISDVDIAHCFKDTAWFPMNRPVRFENRLEITEVLVYALSTVAKKEKWICIFVSI